MIDCIIVTNSSIYFRLVYKSPIRQTIVYISNKVFQFLFLPSFISTQNVRQIEILIISTQNIRQIEILEQWILVCGIDRGHANEGYRTRKCGRDE